MSTSTDDLYAQANRDLRQLTGCEPYYAHIHAYVKNPIFRSRIKRAVKRPGHGWHHLLYELVVAWQGYYYVGAPGYHYMPKEMVRVELSGSLWSRLKDAWLIYRSTLKVHEVNSYEIDGQMVDIEFPVPPRI